MKQKAAEQVAISEAERQKREKARLEALEVSNQKAFNTADADDPAVLLEQWAERRRKQEQAKEQERLRQLEQQS